MVKVSLFKDVEYVFKSPEVDAEPQFTILFPSMPKVFPWVPHLNSWFAYDHAFFDPLWGQQLSKDRNSVLEILSNNSSSEVILIKSPALTIPLKVELVKSRVSVFPLFSIPLLVWTSLPYESVEELIEPVPYDEISSSGLEQASIKDKPKKS